MPFTLEGQKNHGLEENLLVRQYVFVFLKKRNQNFILKCSEISEFRFFFLLVHEFKKLNYIIQLHPEWSISNITLYSSVTNYIKCSGLLRNKSKNYSKTTKHSRKCTKIRKIQADRHSCLSAWTLDQPHEFLK